jgi:hypothetical protein
MGALCACVLAANVAAGSPESVLDRWSGQHLPPGWKLYATDWLRYEQWQHFDPAGDIGDPDYGYGFNRFRLGLKAQSGNWFGEAALQVVNQFSLPADATGVPGGPLGLGAVYFNHNRDTDPVSVYLRSLNLGLRDAFGSGFEVTAGRMDYNSGMETATGVATIDAVKDMRIDSRVIGPFDWSAYQRNFDGVAVKRKIGPGQFNFAALHPTQGGFEHDANDSIEDIDLFLFAYTTPLAIAGGNTELQVFSYLFEDTRHIAVRPDNSGLTATRQDIDLVNLGGHWVGAWNLGPGTLDGLAWGMYQGGDWFGQDNHAWAIAVEGGFQWTRTFAKPWLRAGIYRGSGDDAPGDDRHETFYQMLPTVRKYAYTTMYNLMNNTDVFVQVLLRPMEKLRLRLDYHWLRLTEAGDLWWQGAGATQDHGSIQGFAGRPSGGDQALAQSFEITAMYQVTPTIGLQLFYGRMSGEDVVENVFSEDDDFDLFFTEVNFRF